MASSAAGAAAGGTTTKQLPRDAVVMQSLLKEMGVSLHEPRVINQMLDFVYRYVTTVVEEARVYSSYAKKKTIDVDDVKLAVKMVTSKSFTTVPPREMLLDLAKTKNTTPLPLLKSTSGLRLPPDRFCLTQPNYQLEFYKKAVASSGSQQTASNVRLPGSSSVFKTPQPPHRNIGQPIIQYTPAVTVLNQGQIVTGVKRKLSDEDAWKTS